VSHHQNPFLDLFAFVKEAFSAVLPVRDMPINMNMNMNMNMNISMNNMNNSESLHGHHGNHGDRSCLDILKRLLGGAGGGATELRIAALPVRVLKGAEDTDKLEYDQNCCSICLDGYEHNNRVRILGCGHCYHVQCVDKWLMKRNACPMCSRVVC